MSTEKPEFAYTCDGPFIYGAGGQMCVHGWNAPHALTNEQAQETDRLTNAGLLPARQTITKIDR